MIMEICKGFESCCCRHIPFASDYTGLDTDECKKKSVSHSSEHGPRSSSPLFRKSVPSGTPEPIKRRTNRRSIIQYKLFHRLHRHKTLSKNPTLSLFVPCSMLNLNRSLSTTPMAFTTIYRRSASTIAPLAIRLAQTQRHHDHSALFTALYHTTLSRAPSSISSHFHQSHHHYSSSLAATKRPSSDQTFNRLIDSEIHCAEEADDHDRVEETPSGFPFEIQDNPGQQTITLKRKYQGEVIEVEVQMPDLEPGEEGVDNDDDDDDSEKGSQSSIPLVVSVSKKNGLCLEFSVTALHDEISIDNLAIKDPENSEDQIAYEGPDFLDLDENLQKAFHKYLEIRGIKPSTTNFLHEYMMNKGGREYVIWLKNLKKFVEA